MSQSNNIQPQKFKAKLLSGRLSFIPLHSVTTIDQVLWLLFGILWRAKMKKNCFFY